MNTCGEGQPCESDGNDPPFEGGKSEVVRTEAPREVASFKHIYQSHHRNVYSFCLQMIANRAEAENLMKEAFLKVFREVDTPDCGDPTLATLYRFVITALWMRFHYDQARYDTSPKSETGLHRQNSDLRLAKETPAAISTSAIEVGHLQRAIVQLPLDLRAVFVLHDVLGYEHAKVAEILQFSPHTSRSQLLKVRLHLRECMWGRTQKLVPRQEIRLPKQGQEFGECRPGLENQSEEMRSDARD